jgi:hypothetical protein
MKMDSAETLASSDSHGASPAVVFVQVGTITSLPDARYRAAM